MVRKRILSLTSPVLQSVIQNLHAILAATLACLARPTRDIRLLNELGHISSLDGVSWEELVTLLEGPISLNAVDHLESLWVEHAWPAFL